MMWQHDTDDPRRTLGHRPFVLAVHRSLFALTLASALVRSILDLVGNIRMRPAIVTAATTETKSWVSIGRSVDKTRYALYEIPDPERENKLGQILGQKKEVGREGVGTAYMAKRTTPPVITAA